ncbi:MAG: YafY family protein [Pseudomonadota bacterium]
MTDRISRLFQLLQSLRRLPAPVTARRLAADVDVSERTIHRDIQSLRELGAVIDGASGYGFTLIEDAALPPLAFDDEELEALVLGLREVQQIGDPDLAKSAGTALNKLQSRLPRDQARRLTHAVLAAQRYRPPEQPTVPARMLRQATWEEATIRFAYTDAKGDNTRREADPLALTYMDRSTVLIAWCHLREDYRVFRLDRMADLERTGASFRPRRVSMLRDALARLNGNRENCAEDRIRGD